MCSRPVPTMCMFVKKAGANDLLIPAIKDCILDVDVENGTMKVHLLAGLR